MFHLTTRVNALARITIGGANITATTALQARAAHGRAVAGAAARLGRHEAIDPNGREVALRRGANVLMPILTPTKYRENYQLYEGKPCITDTADECRKCLNARVSMIGKRARMGAWGDPPNFVAPVRSGALEGAVARGLCTWAPLGARRSLHTSPPAPRPAQPELDVVPSHSAEAAAAPAKKAPSAAAGSDVPRVNIGVFGVMNAGKSTLINALTRQETSIVDATPGTTADVKAALMELHDIGPAKLFDTAGVDEEGELGEKKRRKALAALKESDVALVVVDCARHAAAAAAAAAAGAAPAGARFAPLKWERQLLEAAAKYGAVPLLVFNLKRGAWPAAALSALEAAASGDGGHAGAGGAQGMTAAEARLVSALRAALDPAGEAAWAAIDLHGGEGPAARGSEFGAAVADTVATFVQAGVAASRGRNSARSLPDWALGPDASLFLNIPMDAETPSMRLLRPQALVQEEAIRHWSTTTAYRMDLAAARGGDAAAAAAERERFLRALRPLLESDGPKLLVTDSQAIDVVHPWTLDPATGAPLLPITTFSIAMAHRQSGGRLALFVDGLRSLAPLGLAAPHKDPAAPSASSGGCAAAARAMLGPEDRVLIAEACNHNRITSDCNDIGMVQLPAKLREMAGGRGPVVEHAFGREYPDVDGGLGRFRLALHCGGCMIDPQKMRARLLDMEEAGVPVTNYGLFLSYVHDPRALARCLEPWGLSL